MSIVSRSGTTPNVSKRFAPDSKNTDITTTSSTAASFHSLYTTNHNGLVIELATDKFEIPDDRRGEALALAQKKRLRDGAKYAKAEHLEAALDELDLPVERKSLPDAQSGTGGFQ